MGVLDGFTVLRFAYAFEDGAGLETHLMDLNRVLSERNAMTTIQMELTENGNRCRPEESTLGDSLIVKIPLLVKVDERAKTRKQTKEENDRLRRLKDFVRDRILTEPFLFQAFTKHFLHFWRIRRSSWEKS